MISKKVLEKLRSYTQSKFEVHIIQERNQFRYAITLEHDGDVVPLKISRPYETKEGAEFGAKVIEGHFKRLIEA
jgi:hypothetical protein